MPNRQRLLELALKGLEAERAKIDDEIAQIKSQLTHQSATAQIAPPAGRKRMSAGREKENLRGDEAQVITDHSGTITLKPMN